MAGVLALNGADVVEASAHSEHGRALSVFRVRQVLGGSPDWPRIEDQVDRALVGRLALSARIGDRSRTYRPIRLTARPARSTVTVDNSSSATATVLEVTCPDGVGVIYRITRAFTELEIHIVRARAQTLGSDVVGAFYVRDSYGAKVTDSEHLAEIEMLVLWSLSVDL